MLGRRKAEEYRSIRVGLMGSDKRFSTCRGRFANAINFRGFPAIPGNDFVIGYPVPGRGGQGAQG